MQGGAPSIKQTPDLCHVAAQSAAQQGALYSLISEVWQVVRHCNVYHTWLARGRREHGPIRIGR